MKQKKVLLLSVFLVISILVMVSFVFFRYQSNSSVPSFINTGTSEGLSADEFPFREMFDPQGNYIIEIDATVSEIVREYVDQREREETFLVLTSKGVDKPYRIGLGPDIQERFFDNQRLASQTTEVGVIVGTGMHVNEIAEKLQSGDKLTIQLRILSEYKEIEESWKDFFNTSKDDNFEINHNFVSRITLQP